jgi:4-diphosphocytidyl-2-C-methyl-D-erythritol kinase
MVKFPFCKINLGLQVLSRRSDGYHDIETCFYPVQCTDILEVIPSATFQFTSSGIAVPGKEDDNICIKAWQMLRKDYTFSPVKIHLHKVIPPGAGLGGGSSDGAFTLKMLNEIFFLNISRERLLGYAASLGSDCAFFLGDGPALGTGKGEVLTSTTLTLNGKHLMIIKPEIHMATEEAYRGVTLNPDHSNLAGTLERPIYEWRKLLINDFEPPIFERHPAIAEIKKKLYSIGAIYASMSGSGASVFGLFQNQTEIPREFMSMSHFQCEL